MLYSVSTMSMIVKRFVPVSLPLSLVRARFFPQGSIDSVVLPPNARDVDEDAASPAVVVADPSSACEPSSGITNGVSSSRSKVKSREPEDGRARSDKRTFDSESVSAKPDEKTAINFAQRLND